MAKKTTDDAPEADKAPDASPDIAAELVAAKARVAELEDDLRAMRARFDASWRQREEEFAAMKILPARSPPADGELREDAPVRGRVLVATCLLHAHTRDGEKVSIRAGEPIPASVDPATLDKGVAVEKEV